MRVFIPVDAVKPALTHTPNKVVSHLKLEYIFSAEVDGIVGA